MIRSILFTAMAAALVVSCNSDKKGEKSSNETANATETTTVPTENYVANGEIVYVDLVYLSSECKLSLTDGAELDKKVKAYEAEFTRVNEALSTKEQAIAAEFAKNEEDYKKALKTSISYQQKIEELQRRYAELQESGQLEVSKLAEQEKALAEEQVVLANRFTKLVKLAVDNINSDNRYKMVVTNDMIIDADESLNISAPVLAEMDRLYDEGALE